MKGKERASPRIAPWHSNVYNIVRNVDCIGKQAAKFALNELHMFGLFKSRAK
jgi:hypothetical protein